MADDGDPEPIRFRTTKRRKAYRQRPREDEPPTASPSPPGPIAQPPGEPTPPSPGDAQEAHDSDSDEAHDDGAGAPEHQSAAAAALRLRSSHRAARLRGMGFKSDAPPSKHEASSQALVLKDGPDDADTPASGVDGRFMHQTGLLTILDDVHMNEFIEARLASRNAARQAPTPSSSSPTHSAAPAPAPAGLQSRAKDHQPARQGKLFEVAIPEDVRKQDPKRRRVDAKDKRGPARTTDDMQRDAMVEQFLHENRLDVYDVAEASTSRYAPGKDFSADARLAEQFRRQYYEDLALRRKKRRPALSKKEQQQQRAAQASEVLKGPKLGGSRNQRAAIRNILLQQQGEKKSQ